jgi:flavin-dependent dehydrogenase
MTRRATLRGAERTPLEGAAARADVLVCGASFAGLAVARELAGSGADVLVVDRYEIGERQTSACAVPTPWLHAMGVREAIRQELPGMAFHTPHGSARFRLPWSWSSFDYRTLCHELWEQADARFEVAHVTSREAAPKAVTRRRGGGATARADSVAERRSISPFTTPAARAAEPRASSADAASGAVPGDVTVITDRGQLTAPLVVDALGWRRVLGAGANVQPPEAQISRGLEVHPDARGGDEDLDIWIDRSLIRRGYAWSVPAAGEQRVGVGSYEPRDHVKEPTREIAGRLGLPPVRYQGNWFPHALRPAVEDGVFFAGDSAGHCFPLSGEGIRTAFYFGIACGRELRRVLAGEATRAQALAAYGGFSDAHAPAFATALRLQRLIPALPPRALTALLSVVGRERPCRRAFSWYLDQAHPRFAAHAHKRHMDAQVHERALTGG